MFCVFGYHFLAYSWFVLLDSWWRFNDFLFIQRNDESVCSLKALTDKPNLCFSPSILFGDDRCRAMIFIGGLFPETAVSFNGWDQLQMVETA
jgi:hypothetical protein